MAELDEGQQARERTVQRYLSALEDGDFTTVAQILGDAETDPRLAVMLAEVDATLAAALDAETGRSASPAVLRLSA